MHESASQLATYHVSAIHSCDSEAHATCDSYHISRRFEIAQLRQRDRADWTDVSHVALCFRLQQLHLTLSTVLAATHYGLVHTVCTATLLLPHAIRARGAAMSLTRGSLRSILIYVLLLHSASQVLQCAASCKNLAQWYQRCVPTSTSYGISVASGLASYDADLQKCWVLPDIVLPGGVPTFWSTSSYRAVNANRMEVSVFRPTSWTWVQNSTIMTRDSWMYVGGIPATNSAGSSGVYKESITSANTNFQVLSGDVLGVCFPGNGKVSFSNGTDVPTSRAIQYDYNYARSSSVLDPNQILQEQSRVFDVILGIWKNVQCNRSPTTSDARCSFPPPPSPSVSSSTGISGIQQLPGEVSNLPSLLTWILVTVGFWLVCVGGQFGWSAHQWRKVKQYDWPDAHVPREYCYSNVLNGEFEHDVGPQDGVELLPARRLQ